MTKHIEYFLVCLLIPVLFLTMFTTVCVLLIQKINEVEGCCQESKESNSVFREGELRGEVNLIKAHDTHLRNVY